MYAIYVYTKKNSECIGQVPTLEVFYSEKNYLKVIGINENEERK